MFNFVTSAHATTKRTTLKFCAIWALWKNSFDNILFALVYLSGDIQRSKNSFGYADADTYFNCEIFSSYFNNLTRDGLVRP